MFNGRDLSGWKMSDPNATSTWKVESGTLVSPGHGPELISDAKFEDFKLHIEFNCAPGSNSGVYLRGRYELQIEDDPQPEESTMRTGGVYGFLAPSPEQPRRPGEWQSYDITLVGRVVTVVQNGQTIIDKQEIPASRAGHWTVTKDYLARSICRVVKPVTSPFGILRLRQQSDLVRLHRLQLIPVIPFYAELQRIRETIETVAEERIRL